MKTDLRSTRRAALVLAAAGWPLGCRGYDFGGLLPVRGSGRLVRNELDLPAFDSLEASGSVVMELEQGQPPHASLETDDNLAPLYEVQVKNGTLRVQHRGHLSPTRLHIVLKVWKLQNIVVSGSASVTAGALVAKNLSLRASGSAVLTLGALTAETLEVQGGGSSVLKLAGQANALSVAAGGSADIDARALQVRRVSVSAGGSARASVWASDTLSGAVGGSASLQYRGDPALSTTRGGSASVTRLP